VDPPLRIAALSRLYSGRALLEVDAQPRRQNSIESNDHHQQHQQVPATSFTGGLRKNLSFVKSGPSRSSSTARESKARRHTRLYIGQIPLVRLVVDVL